MSEDAGVRSSDWPGAVHAALAIVADTRESAALVEAAGWPVAATASDHGLAADILVVDWRLLVPPELSGISGDCAVLALVSLDTIDAADAVLRMHDARFVFGSSAPLIASELSELGAIVRGGQALDPSRDERARLQSLATELARLAEQLGALSEQADSATGDSALGEQGLAYQAEGALDRLPARPPSVERIRHLIAMRRLRDRFFSPDLFADPAWDILLDLAASRIEDRPVSVSSLCIAAAVPPTTALRWIRMMTDQALLERRADPADARRMFVDLSDAAFEQLCGWFALVEARGGLGV